MKLPSLPGEAGTHKGFSPWPGSLLAMHTMWLLFVHDAHARPGHGGCGAWQLLGVAVLLGAAVGRKPT